VGPIVLTYINGDIFKGELKENKKNGAGIYIFK
jgi:hypothetical protein